LLSLGPKYAGYARKNLLFLPICQLPPSYEPDCNHQSCKKNAKKDVNPQSNYTINCGYLGNGLTVWNSAREVNRDYEPIAHISNDGKTISWRDKTGTGAGFPADVIERVNQMAQREARKWQEEKQYSADCTLSYRHWLLTHRYSKEAIVRKEGPFDETDADAVATARDRIKAY